MDFNEIEDSSGSEREKNFKDYFINNKETLENRKVIIDKELWYIPDFLTKEELDYIKPFCDDKTGWYLTSRSSSIRNKFIGVNYRIHPEGTICPTRGIDLSNSAIFPDETDLRYHPELWYKAEGVFDRMKVVLPNRLNEDITLQSFWPLDDSDHSGAYQWHWEKSMAAELGDTEFNDFGMTAAWSIYLNEDFEDGQLEFAYKPYVIKPKAGMLISIPMTKEFTHRVTPVKNGERHTLYGTCFQDLNDREISNGETC